MKHPTPDYLLLAVSEAIRSVIGAGVAMLLTCMLGGAIPLAACWTQTPDRGELLVLTIAWIGHWLMAGLMVWGLLVAVVPAWCLYELLHGRTSVWLILSVALSAQLLVSTVAVCLTNHGGEWQRPAAASLSALAVMVLVRLVALRAARKRTQSQEASSADYR